MDSNLKKVISELNKKHDNVIITNGKKEKIKSISTGSYILDSQIGISGFPIGKIVEIAGGEAAGKTSLAIAAMSSFQKNDKSRKVAFIDLEHTYDMEMTSQMGIDNKKLIYVNAISGEEASDIAMDLIKTDKVSLVVIDSVSAMVSLAEMEDSIGDAKIGMLGRLMSKLLRKITPLADKHKVTVIFLNQLRDKIGGYKAMYGETRQSTGGNALKFYASLRIQLTKGKAYINEDDTIVGHKINFRITKNKVGLPNKKGWIPLIYAKGISTIDELIEIATALKVIIKKGAFYYYVIDEKNQQKIGQGIVQTRKYFEDNESSYKILHEACKQELAYRKKNRFVIKNERYKEK